MSYIVTGGGHVDREKDAADDRWAKEDNPVAFVRTPLHHAAEVDMAIMANSDAVIISAGSFGFWGVCTAPVACGP